MKRKTKRILTVSFTMLVSLILLIGCGPSVKPQANVAGVILLSVNPEIEIDYDEKGNTIAVRGTNEDGRNVMADFDDYLGNNVGDVLSELIEEIYEAGYFSETIGESDRNVIIKLARGSRYPNDRFLENLEQTVVITLNKIGVASSPVTIDKDDVDEQGRISIETAKIIALKQVGAENAEFEKAEYDKDDQSYEFEFRVGELEYDVNVHAFSGKILSYESDDADDDDLSEDLDDDRDDADDDDLSEDPDDDRDDADDDDDED